MDLKEFEELKYKTFHNCCRVKGYYDDPFKTTFEEGMQFMKETIVDILMDSCKERDDYELMIKVVSSISKTINEPVVTSVQKVQPIVLAKNINTIKAFDSVVSIV